MEKLKAFEDLEFEEHKARSAGFRTHAVMLFENGYGVSVITGGSARADDEGPYELAVLRHEGDKRYCLCYDTPITDDVVGYLTVDGVTELMRRVQEL